MAGEEYRISGCYSGDSDIRISGGAVNNTEFEIRIINSACSIDIDPDKQYLIACRRKIDLNIARRRDGSISRYIIHRRDSGFRCQVKGCNDMVSGGYATNGNIRIRRRAIHKSEF